MYRTIEQILGLPPRNQFDLAAEPMFTTFTAKADFTPYTARPNTIPLDEMNPALAGLQGLQRDLAKFSLTIDSSEPDSAPADLLNRAICALGQGIRHAVQLRPADQTRRRAGAFTLASRRVLAPGLSGPRQPSGSETLNTDLRRNRHAGVIPSDNSAARLRAQSARRTWCSTSSTADRHRP
jgi:hypothetical protein